MPLIQGDFKVGLTDLQKETLVKKLVDVVHTKLGSSIPHISVVVRDSAPCAIAEAGQVGRVFELRTRREPVKADP